MFSYRRQPPVQHEYRGTLLLKVLLLVVTACLAILVPSFGLIVGMLAHDCWAAQDVDRVHSAARLFT